MNEIFGSEDRRVEMIVSAMMSQKFIIRPGLIVKFNASASTVDAMIAIKRKRTIADEIEYLDMPVIPGVPLVIPYDQGSGLCMTMPIREGNKCCLLFSDRCIAEFIRTGMSAYPEVLGPDNTQTIPRMHHMGDAICFPGLITLPDAIVEWNNEAIELRNRDRTSYVSVGDNVVSMVNGDASHTIENNTVRTIAPNGYYVDAPNWSTDENGVYANGVIRGTDIQTTAGFSGNGHRHSGVEPGSGTSGTFV